MALCPPSYVGELKQRFVECIQQKQGKDLDLSALELSQCPTQVSENVKLRKLLRLNLQINKIRVWPDLRPLADSLAILSVGGNQLRSLDGPGFGCLTNLKDLSLNGNQIVALPNSIGNFTGLQKLNLSNNNLNSLPIEIGYLCKLEDLDVSGNPNLKELPRTCRDLTSLEELNADFCSLTSIPSELTYCSRLLELSLAKNKLISLPSDIGRLSRLTRLNISDNRLTDLPISMGMCESLGQFGAGATIDGNPIKNQEIWKAYKIGPDHLLFYLQKKMDVVYGGSAPPLPDVPDHNLLKRRDVSAEDLGPIMTSIDLGILTGGADRKTSLKVAGEAQASTQKARAEREQLRKKVEQLRKWGNEQCNFVYLPKLRKIRRALEDVKTEQQAQGLLQFAKKLESPINELIQLIPFQEPPVVSQPPPNATRVQLLVHRIDTGCTSAFQVIEDVPTFTCIGCSVFDGCLDCPCRSSPLNGMFCNRGLKCRFTPEAADPEDRTNCNAGSGTNLETCDAKCASWCEGTVEECQCDQSGSLEKVVCEKRCRYQDNKGDCDLGDLPCCWWKVNSDQKNGPAAPTDTRAEGYICAPVDGATAANDSSIVHQCPECPTKTEAVLAAAVADSNRWFFLDGDIWGPLSPWFSFLDDKNRILPLVANACQFDNSANCCRLSLLDGNNTCSCRVQSPSDVVTAFTSQFVAGPRPCKLVSGQTTNPRGLHVRVGYTRDCGGPNNDICGQWRLVSCTTEVLAADSAEPALKQGDQLFFNFQLFEDTGYASGSNGGMKESGATSAFKGSAVSLLSLLGVLLQPLFI